MSLHRYQVLTPLLAGEGSRAFLGLQIHDERTACPAVLVWLPERFADDADALAQLRRETQRASLLEHPHITRVFGLASMDEGLARAVEFVDGESLRAMLHETGGKLPPLIAARVIADAAGGVHYAHVAGNDDGSPLLHGDLRPETLMLSYEGVCKVAGYGALAVAPRESSGKRVKGRRLYAAPEQVLGGRNAIDRQSDVFLLGLSLYECVTGRAPFAETSDLDRAIVQTPLPRVRGDLAAEALNQVIQRATSKRASQRHPSALAFKEHLEEVVEGLPTHESVAAYLMNFFVEARPARMLRQEVLDRALKDFAAASSERMAPVIPMRAPPVSVEARPAAVASRRGGARGRGGGGAVLPRGGLEAEPDAPPTPAARREAEPDVPPKSAARRAAGRAGSGALPPEYEDESPRRRGPSLAWLLASVVLGAAVGWGLLRDRTPRAPGPVPVAVAPSPVVPPAPPPLQLSSPPPVPAPVAAPAGVELVVTPAVDVYLGKVHQGRTPLMLALPEGRHLLRLADERRGINVFKAVSVRPGSSEPIRLALAEATLDLGVPEGALIYVNGRFLGDSTLDKEVLTEGWQHVVVKWKGERWEETFHLKPSEHVAFKAEFSASDAQAAADEPVQTGPSAESPDAAITEDVP